MKTIKKYKIIQLLTMFALIIIWILLSNKTFEFFLPYLIGVLSGYFVFVLAEPISKIELSSNNR